MKVVFTAAVMDLCHRGHINLLKKMREEAGADGKVVVFLHDDKTIYQTKGKIPIQRLSQRVSNVIITGLANKVYTCGDFEDLANQFEDLIRKEQGEGNSLVFMRGDDWKDFPARQVVDKYGVAIKFVPYTEGVSSTLIRKELEERA